MEDYKQDIENTRKGCLGGSDAKMLAQIAQTGIIPNSAHKRLAVCKGLIENENITTPAMRYGDYIENCVFSGLKQSDDRWQSNPCLVSKKYSRKNCKLIDHVDYYLEDESKHLITIGECKASKHQFRDVRKEYEPQLIHHYLLGSEVAKQKGKDWKVRLLLCHYNTEGIDLEQPFEFDPNRLTVRPVNIGKFDAYAPELARAMDIVDSFLETYTYYSEDDTIPYEYLPVAVKEQFDNITKALVEIKEREQKVKDFKAKLYNFFKEQNIKSIKNPDWSVTRVDPTESTTFDAKAFAEDYAKQHPLKFKKAKAAYTKTTKKSGYINIRLKTAKDKAAENK